MGFKESGEELLLKLPCKIGDTIWDNDFGSPCSYKVTGFSYGDLNDDYEEMPTDELIVYYRDRSGCITGSFPVSEIGESVFFTRKEAAEKRKEMEDAK